MKTKILLMITIATIAMSCKKTEENNTENQNAVTETTVSQAPKCGDKEVKEEIMSGIKTNSVFDLQIDTSSAQGKTKKLKLKIY